MPTPPDLQLSAGVVPAGRYRLPGFSPGVTVELDGSWQAVAIQPGYAGLTQIARPPGSTPYRAGTLVQITEVDSAGSDAALVKQPTTAAQVVEALRASLGDMFVGSTGSKIGGIEGTQVTVARPGDGPPMSLNVVEVLDVPPGSIVMEPGNRLLIDLLQGSSGVIAVIVNSSTANWDAELAAAQPVLDSIEIEAP